MASYLAVSSMAARSMDACNKAASSMATSGITPRSSNDVRYIIETTLVEYVRFLLQH